MAERLIRADLHTHNIYSPDSSASPKDVVEGCIRRGIGCLAVTNHNTVDGANETQDIANSQGANLIVIRREEITTGAVNSAGKKVELLAYFLEETIPYGLTIEETLKRIKNQRAIAGVPHPYELWRHGAGREIGNQVIRYAQELGVPVLWEVFNSRARNINNLESSKSPHKLKSAGSDAHHANEIGRARILLIPWECRTPDELKQGFLKSMESAREIEGNDSFLRTFYYRVLTRVSNLTKTHPDRIA